MRRNILILIATFLSFQIHSQTITIKGSDTMLPLVQAMSEIYMDTNPSSLVTVTGGGSGTGITALEDGTVDMAMASRALKMSEKLSLKSSGRPYKEIVIAYDALSIILHNSNKVGKLTRQEIEDIFVGKITNWKEVGGKDMPIVVYTRTSSSGTYEFMKKFVMQKKEFVASSISVASNSGIVQSVSQTPGAISYCGLAYVEDIIKPVAVSFDEGKTYVKPTFKNALYQEYPISRPLYFYHIDDDTEKIKPFIQFVLTELGQKLVTHKGYIPVDASLVDEEDMK